MQTLEGKPQIDYPTMWEYRVIGENKEVLKNVIAQSITQDYTLKEGQSSSSGKFLSLVVSTIVKDEAQRDKIFQSLRENPNVKMVL